MQKKVTFKSKDGVAKEFIANITEIDVTTMGPQQANIFMQ